MILVHGGVGKVAPDRVDRVRQGVRDAAAKGKNLLDRGGTALDAVVAAVRHLEDDPEFGAGIGSSLTREGTIETCASVMDGARRRAGAVAAVPNLGAPIIVARAVLELGEQVVLAGHGALRYMQEIGMTTGVPDALITPRARAAWAEVQAGGKLDLEGGGVGAVARDKTGGLAAATSSGGTIYRRAGAVDDAAIPGIGTWADEHVAISTSGGEAVFRVSLAANIARRIADGDGIRKAAKGALQELHKLVPEGLAGIIAVNKDSWCALQLGPAMPCAWIDDFGPKDELGFPL